jgi:Phage derived protein Gp49-like (DUF891)
LHNLKELRPGSAGGSEVRVLFVFGPWRSAILLVAGGKAGNWQSRYREMTPRAEQLYAIYLKERAEEEGRTQGPDPARCRRLDGRHRRRVSQIEGGDFSGIDVLDRYVMLKIVANFGDEQFKVS